MTGFRGPRVPRGGQAEARPRGVAFFAAVFFPVAFLAVVFLAAVFFAVDLVADALSAAWPVDFAVDFATVFFAAVFLVVDVDFFPPTSLGAVRADLREGSG